MHAVPWEQSVAMLLNTSRIQKVNCRGKALVFHGSPDFSQENIDVTGEFFSVFCFEKEFCDRKAFIGEEERELEVCVGSWWLHAFQP